MNAFEGKTILLIGGYSAIGMAAAARLAREGARLVAVGRDAAKLADAVKPWAGAGHHAIAADAASWEQLQGVVELGRRLGGYAGALVCAGLHEIRPLGIIDAEHLARSYEANVTTAVLTARAVMRAAHKDGASIVWVSSIAAMRGTATFTAYAAAKGALISAARCIAIELASRRIRINVLAAGVVRTPMSQSWLSHLTPEQLQFVEKDHPLGVGQPDDLAGIIRFLLSDDSRWMTGSVVTADGGLSAK